MKKIYTVLLVFILSACSTTPDTPKKEVEEKQKQETPQALSYANLSWGSGNKDGFYRILCSEDENEQTSYHITYTDYASKKEIYLCDKPECKHVDESCTSYIDASQFDSKLLVNGKHLYRFVNEHAGTSITDEGITEATGAPKLYQMDLDGKNKKVLYEAPDAYKFLTNNLIVRDEVIYVQMNKEELVQTSNNSSMGVVTSSGLYRIDLMNGKLALVLDLKNCFIKHASDTSIIIQQMHYEVDPQTLLDKKDFKGYDEAQLQATSTYHLYDIDKQSYEQEVSIGKYIPIDFNQTKLFYIDNENHLCSTDIQTQETNKLIQLDKDGNYSSSYIKDDYMMLEKWSNTEDNTLIEALIYNLKENHLDSFPLTMEHPKETMTLLSSNGKQYFMLYDRDGHIEDTWAGTKQYEIDHKYYGLINIEDFWQGKRSFEVVASLQGE